MALPSTSARESCRCRASVVCKRDPPLLHRPSTKTRADRSADLDQAMAGGEYQGLESGVHAQLGQYVHHVGALRVHAHVQFGRYLLVREALGELLQNLLFAGCELLDARARFELFLAVLSGQAEQLGKLILGEQGLAFAEASRGIEYGVDIGRLVQDPGRPGFDRPGVLRPVQARGQDERREVRVGFVQLPNQLGTLSVRQGEVYNPEVGLRALHRPARLGECPCLGDYLELGLLIEDERECLTERSVILYKQDSPHFSLSQTSLVILRTKPIYQLC